MTIGDYIKEYRKEMNISQRKFAEMCGLSHVYINMLENGKNPKTDKPVEVSIQKYKAIAEGTGTTLDNLFEILGPDAPVKIENRQILSFPDYTRPFNPDVMDAVSDEKQILFRLARKAKPEAIRAAVAVLKSMEETNDEF